jgi:PleD family two-component response regulator
MPVQGATASIGIAECVAGDTVAALLARADAALYRAKARGRARAEVADPIVAASTG